MMQRRGTRAFVAGTANLLDTVDNRTAVRAKLVSSGRWSEVLY